MFNAQTEILNIHTNGDIMTVECELDGELFAEQINKCQFEGWLFDGDLVELKEEIYGEQYYLFVHMYIMDQQREPVYEPAFDIWESLNIILNHQVA